MLINYLLFLMAFQPLEEYYNCLYPNLDSELLHFVCTWEEEDFIYWNISKQYELKKYRKSDNKYKAKARKKYWDKKLI